LLSGGIDASSWELPPEVQDLINKQKKDYSSNRSPFENLPDINQLNDNEPPNLTSSKENPFDFTTPAQASGSQVFSLGDEELPDFFSSIDKSSSVESPPKQPSQESEFNPFDFLFPSEDTQTIDTSEKFSDAGAFDFLTPGKETSPVEPFEENSFAGESEYLEQNYSFGDRLNPLEPDESGGSETNQPTITTSANDQSPTLPLSQVFQQSSYAGQPVVSDLRSIFEPVSEVNDALLDQSAIPAAPPAFIPAGEPNVSTKIPMNNRTRLLIALGVMAASLTFVIVLAIFIIARSNPISFPFTNQSTALPATPLVQVAPQGLEMTGGWTFNLIKSNLKDGVWVPQGGAEWLNGSELRRVVALPWSMQLEAVVQTLKSGDPIRMLMANNDILTFRVEKIEKVSREQVDILGGNTPGLVIILYRKDSNDRLVVICQQ
jgi:hypothetical protein